MYCQKCGNLIPADSKECEKCGAIIISNHIVQPVAQPVKKSKLPNFIAIIAAIVLALGAFLPYASVSIFGISKSTSLLDGGDGIFFLVAAGIALLFALFNLNIGVIIMGVISVGLAVFEAVTFENSNTDALGLLNKEIGYYLMIIGAIAVFVSGIIGAIIKAKRK